MLRYNKIRSAVLILYTLSFALFFQGCNEDKLEVNATGILDGTVMDFTSEVNLSGAVLTTNPPSVSVASDSTGYFIFKTIPYSISNFTYGYFLYGVADFGIWF